MATYTDLKLRAYQPRSTRDEWRDFVTEVSSAAATLNIEILPNSLANLQYPEMLIFAGIESVSAEQFELAVSKNHFPRRLWLGDIKTAIAVDLELNQVTYETVYIEMIDNLDTRPTPLPLELSTSSGIIYPPTLRNMRRRILQMGVNRSRTRLPLWMRSIQPGDSVEPGFVPAIELCRTVPGKSFELSLIIKQIAQSRSLYTLVDFHFDRYIADAIDGNFATGEQYIIFPQGSN